MVSKTKKTGNMFHIFSIFHDVVGDRQGWYESNILSFDLSQFNFLCSWSQSAKEQGHSCLICGVIYHFKKLRHFPLITRTLCKGAPVSFRVAVTFVGANPLRLLAFLLQLRLDLKKSNSLVFNYCSLWFVCCC